MTSPALDTLLTKLEKVRETKGGWSACCPAHEDGNASLSVSVGDDGRILLRCFAGCSFEKVAQAVGMEASEFAPPTLSAVSTTRKNNRKKQGTADKPPTVPSGKPFPTMAAAIASLGRNGGTWPYENADGVDVGIVVRINQEDGKKRFVPISRWPDGWHYVGMPEPRPLYQLPTLKTSDVVYVTEGEKAADAARSIGFIATTSPHGSQSADKADWSPLAGKKVIVLPDNDIAGRKYAEEVRAILLNLNPPAQVIEVNLPGLGEGDDIVEWVDNHGDAATPETMRAELEKLVAEVEQIGQGHAVKHVDDEPPAQWRPFPVELLPGAAGELVRAAAAAMRCDAALVSLPVLAVLAASIGLTRTLRIKSSWHAVSILWLAVVAESGSLKSPAFSIAMKPLRERERRAHERHRIASEAFESDLVLHEIAVTEWKRSKTGGAPPERPQAPIAERYTTSNTTIEALATILQENPRGVLIAVDELAGWFGSFDRYAGGKSGGDAAGWLSLYNGDVLAVDRKTGTAPRIFVPRAGVSVTGTIQPGILKRHLGTDHRESGLAARLLMASPPRIRQVWTEDDVAARIEAAYADVVAWLCNLSFSTNEHGESVPVALGMTPEARRIWIDHFNAHAAEQVALTGDIAAAWSKLQEVPARLALILHLTRLASEDASVELPSDVDAKSMADGIELADWFKHEAKRVYNRLAESDEASDERRLIEWITARGGRVREREVQTGCRWLAASGMAEEALQGLVTSGCGEWVPIPSKATGGRPCREFHLKTQPVVSTTPRNPKKN